MERTQILEDFLGKSGWGDADRSTLAGDASFRRYDRMQRNSKAEMDVSTATAVLMDAPPPQENVRPFINIARFLKSHDYSAPEIFAEDPENGFLLLEDLGDDRFTCVMNGETSLTYIPAEKDMYTLAVDVLAALHTGDMPENIAEYDNAMLMREVALLPDWYLPLLYGDEKAAGIRDEYMALWEEIIPQVHITPQAMVYRDYHADNLMWLPERDDIQKVGLLDFQDTVIGSPAYDLVSLLEDARRDVDRDMATEMVEYYLSIRPDLNRNSFLTSYAILGAQRNCKILGIFSRLAVRDGKDTYLSLLPRVWGHVEHDLQHPALASLKQLLDKLVPDSDRKTIPTIPQNMKKVSG